MTQGLQNAHESRFRGSWTCELCRCWTPPGLGARHHCRRCSRTVCGNCSSLRGSRETRICCDCRFSSDKRSPRVKYLFLVRHAQSTWNRQLDRLKTVTYLSPSKLSVKDVVSSAMNMMSKEAWDTDHSISEEGLKQTSELHGKIKEARMGALKPEDEDEECRRRQPFYEAFLSQRGQIYCSPLLRALQTAHLALPQDSFGDIKLLKEAREHFKKVYERDNLGSEVGSKIVDRAVQMNEIIPGLASMKQRVDVSECNEKWWSDEPETDADLQPRLEVLWNRLLADDPDHPGDSCILVTHSNLIKAILTRFGILSVARESEQQANQADSTGSEDEDSGEDVVDHTMSWQVVDDGPDSMRQLKLNRIQNCGVLGLRCELETRGEFGGWIEVTSREDEELTPTNGRWVVKDALLMFDSVLIN
mmetsp:Transcript_23730/g.43001  ORF Transcript_23730/g.43001 Transcript_23730/m.43001 type:complete len:418 (+) Transcript_23730:53-1306(+)